MTGVPRSTVEPKPLVLAWLSGWCADDIELLGTVPEGTRPDDVKASVYGGREVVVGTLDEFLAAYLGRKLSNSAFRRDEDD